MLLAIGAAACDGGSSGTGITEPAALGNVASVSSARHATPASRRPPTMLARVLGMLRFEARRARSGSLEGIRVSIEGTSIETQTDAAGFFSLRGDFAGPVGMLLELPEGGSRARLVITVPRGGQLIVTNVQLDARSGQATADTQHVRFGGLVNGTNCSQQPRRWSAAILRTTATSIPSIWLAHRFAILPGTRWVVRTSTPAIRWMWTARWAVMARSRHVVEVEEGSGGGDGGGGRGSGEGSGERGGATSGEDGSGSSGGGGSGGEESHRSGGESGGEPNERGRRHPREGGTSGANQSAPRDSLRPRVFFLGFDYVGCENSEFSRAFPDRSQGCACSRRRSTGRPAVRLHPRRFWCRRHQGRDTGRRDPAPATAVSSRSLLP